MKRAVAAVVVVLALGGLYAAWRAGLFAERAVRVVDDDRPRREAARGTEPVAVDLFFPSPAGFLYPERREIADPGTPADLAAAVLAELFAGPRSERLRPPMPSDVSVRRVYLVGEGTAMIDLGREGETPFLVGSQQELLALYSLVNTVALNVDGASRVIVLWNGEQPTTFAGHVDTTRPLVPDLDLVAGRGRGEAADATAGERDG